MAFGKRIDGPGGHRRALRNSIMVRVAMSSRMHSQSVDLIDLSQTGAKLRGPGLPGKGQDVMINVGDLDALGKIVWRDDGQCGVLFDIALTESALAAVQLERGPSTLANLSHEELLAVGDWLGGLAR